MSPVEQQLRPQGSGRVSNNGTIFLTGGPGRPLVLVEHISTNTKVQHTPSRYNRVRGRVIGQIRRDLRDEVNYTL